MNRPQQVNLPGTDNLPSGELRWDSMASGKHRVRYRRLDGVALPPFTGSPEEAEVKFFEWKADLEMWIEIAKIKFSTKIDGGEE